MPGSERHPAPVAAPRLPHLWLGYLSLGAAGLVGYYLLPTALTRDVGYLVLGLYGVAGILAGVRLQRVVAPLPWHLMAVGLLLWITGDTLFAWYENVRHVDPFPSWADAFYLAGYPVIAVGLHLLIRRRRITGDLGGALDSATVTVGLGLLSWVVLAQPTIDSSRESFVTAAVAAAYPVADILLLAGLVRLLTLSDGESASLRLLLVAITLLIAADTLFVALELYGAGESHTIDFLWLASYVIWGAAALHPSVHDLALPVLRSAARFRRRRLVAMTLATLIAPGILAVEHLADLRLDVIAVILGSVLMFLLVVARMWLAIDQITESNAELRRLQDELAFQAAHDPLTGLPNRAEAARLVHRALARARRTGRIVALLFIDLDGFKAVNDSHGHPAGDEVLRTVARRLTDELRAGDVAARLGGDEFVVLLEDLEAEPSAEAVAARLIDMIRRPIGLSVGLDAEVGASIGISYNRDERVDADLLLHDADVAVYRAKQRGRGRVETFSETLGTELAERAELRAALERALRNDELVLFYQPIIRVTTGQLEGYEALVRWERPGHGLVPPSEFIPFAERSELICDLDHWVLDRATEQLARWNRTSGARDLLLSVNISGRHVTAPQITDEVRTALEEHGVDPSQLILEITETVLVEDRVAIENLHALRRLGVTLSLDDWGTGYNSIAQLSRLPVDMVKIDRSYLDPTTHHDQTLLRLMVHVAHTFGLTVVGEGVEQDEQLALLAALEVESAQGFLLGRPVPAVEIEQRLATTGAGG